MAMTVYCAKCGSTMVECAECQREGAYPYACPRGCARPLPLTSDLTVLCPVHRPVDVTRVPWVGRGRGMSPRVRARMLLNPPTRRLRRYTGATA